MEILSAMSSAWSSAAGPTVQFALVLLVGWLSWLQIQARRKSVEASAETPAATCVWSAAAAERLSTLAEKVDRASEVVGVTPHELRDLLVGLRAAYGRIEHVEDVLRSVEAMIRRREDETALLQTLRDELRRQTSGET